MAKCLTKAAIQTVVIVGPVYGGAYVLAAYVPPAAVIIGYYVVKKYGRYYTVVRWALKTNACYGECKDCEESL